MRFFFHIFPMILHNFSISSFANIDGSTFSINSHLPSNSNHKCQFVIPNYFTPSPYLEMMRLTFWSSKTNPQSLFSISNHYSFIKSLFFFKLEYFKNMIYKILLCLFKNKYKIILNNQINKNTLKTLKFILN